MTPCSFAWKENESMRSTAEVADVQQGLRPIPSYSRLSPASNLTREITFYVQYYTWIFFVLITIFVV